MRVIMSQPLSLNGEDHPAGQSVDLPDLVAERLMISGAAVPDDQSAMDAHALLVTLQSIVEIEAIDAAEAAPVDAAPEPAPVEPAPEVPVDPAPAA